MTDNFFALWNHINQAHKHTHNGCIIRSDFLFPRSIFESFHNQLSNGYTVVVVYGCGRRTTNFIFISHKSIVQKSTFIAVNQAQIYLSRTTYITHSFIGVAFFSSYVAHAVVFILLRHHNFQFLWHFFLVFLLLGFYHCFLYRHFVLSYAAIWVKFSFWNWIKSTIRFFFVLIWFCQLNHCSGGYFAASLNIEVQSSRG